MRVVPMLGEFTLEGAEYIESSESRTLVEHSVPGLAGNYFQDMGTAPNTIVIAGSRHGDEAREAFLGGVREIFNSGRPTTFVADINTATDVSGVVIEDLQVAEVAGSPDSFRYLIRLREYIAPPEPAAPRLLEDDILADARNLVDALDVIDGLISIPDLDDPTRPLQGMLDGVKSTLAGLGRVEEGLKNLFGTGAQ